MFHDVNLSFHVIVDVLLVGLAHVVQQRLRTTRQCRSRQVEPASCTACQAFTLFRRK